MVIDALLAAILRGEHVDAEAFARHDPEELVLAASHHDVVPLVADRLAVRGDVPGPLQSVLRERAGQALATDMLREVELRRFVAELDAASVGSLIIKGSHLAYAHYPRPDLRPRADTDILVMAGSQTWVHEILTATLGYEAISRISGEFIAGERLYIKYRDGAIVHAVHVQWRMPSPHLITGVASYTHMADTAVPLPRLGAGARGPSDAYALLIACMHRYAHHHEAVHFKRLYDIHLIARSLTRGQWEEFTTLAGDQKVSAVCRRSLERTAYWFRTGIPLGVQIGATAHDAPAASSNQSV